MSHQTGIGVSPELKDAFIACQQPANRFVKIQIQTEQLVPVKTQASKGNWEQDFSLVQPALEKDEPCYIAYRKDDNSFLLLCYVPDLAKVRDKMLYAATKASLTKELGDSNFMDSVYATHTGDLTLDGYKKHQRHQNAEAPLTLKEEELKRVKMAEVGTDIAVSSRKTHVSGISFPISDPAVNAIRRAKTEDILLRFEIVDEHLELKGQDEPNDLAGALRKINAYNLVEPCFVLLRAKASNASTQTVFLYICPGESSVRLRMLYASSRTAMYTYIEEEGVQIAKKLEVTDVEDLTVSYLETELGIVSTQQTSNKSFIKKTLSGPGGGARRLVKKSD